RFSGTTSEGGKPRSHLQDVIRLRQTQHAVISHCIGMRECRVLPEEFFGLAAVTAQRRVEFLRAGVELRKEFQNRWSVEKTAGELNGPPTNRCSNEFSMSLTDGMLL